MLTIENIPDFPYKKPFLFISRIMHVSEESASTVHSFDAEDPFIKGHFDGRYVPGCLLTEQICQTAFLIFLLNERVKPATIYLGAAKSTFLQPVKPGVTVVATAKVNQRLPNAVSLHGWAMVNDQKVITVTATASLIV